MTAPWRRVVVTPGARFAARSRSFRMERGRAAALVRVASSSDVDVASQRLPAVCERLNGAREEVSGEIARVC